MARNVEAIRANQSYTKIDLSVLLTDSNTAPFLGIVPDLGVVCDNTTEKRLNFNTYNGDARTAQVMKENFFLLRYKL